MQKWAALLLCLGLTACYLDPYDNPGNWSLTGATRRNIAAQAANPSDLINAKSNPDSDGVAASSAIDKGFAGSGGTAAGVLPPPSPTTLNVTGG